MSLDLGQFHAVFFEESAEALDAMESALLKLSAGEVDAELINTVFRAAHSTKGGAAALGFAEVTAFTHALETYLDALRGGSLAVDSGGIELLLQAVDLLRSMLANVQQGKAVDQQPVMALQFDFECRLQALHSANIKSGQCESAAVGVALDCEPDAKMQLCSWHINFKPHQALFQHGDDPVRMFAELQRLGRLQPRVDISALPPLGAMNPQLCYLAWELNVLGEVPQAEVEAIFEWVADDCHVVIQAIDAAAEPQPPTQLTSRPVIDSTGHIAPRPQTDPPQTWHSEHGSIRVSTEKLDELINRVSELVITQSMLNELGDSAGTTRGNRLQSGLERLERNTRELQESVMRMRMRPINAIFSRFPRVVHDLSRMLDKQVELVLCGEQTELDKTVLEKIGDPLLHLLRNAIDHGIETPQKRRRLGKPETGCLSLEAFHQGGRITIRLSDDGAGLDCKKILAKARAAGLVKGEELSDEAIWGLIFQPGLSTAEKTTDLSGRGVGMDVVRKNIRALGGSVEVSSEAGKGTTFSVVLPLTLAILEGQFVALGDESYIIPLASIVELLQLRSELIGSVAGRCEAFLFRGEYVPILYLDELFGIRLQARSLAESLLVIVESDERRIGIVVDDLLGQQQVVIKSLEENYRKVEGISGATILRGGSVALILDVPGLMGIAQERGAA